MREGWRHVPVSSVADLNPESLSKKASPPAIRYIDISAVSSSGIDLTSLRELAISDAPSRAQRVVRRDDILISTVRPYLRARARVPRELDGCVASTGFCVLRPRSEVDPGYLDVATSTDGFYAHLERRQTGTAYPAVRPVDVGDALMPLPPIEEQQRVADVLNAVDAGIAAAQLTHGAARNLLTALTAQLESQAEKVMLGTLLAGIEGGRSLATLERPAAPGERAVLKVSAVRPGRFLPEEAKALSLEAAMPERAVVRRGDVLITRANTAELVGAVCRVNVEPELLFLSDKTLRLAFDETRADPDFFVHALAAPDVRRQIADVATGSSASMKNISQEKIRALRVAAPPLGRQKEWCATFAGVAAVAQAQEDRASALRLLRVELIRRLLAGAHDIPVSYDRFLSDRADSERGPVGS